MNPLYVDPNTLLPKPINHKPSKKEITEMKEIRKAFLSGAKVQFSMRYDPTTWIPLHKNSYMKSRSIEHWVRALSEVKYRLANG